MGFRKSQIVLFSGLFLVMVGFGITLPVLPFYIQKISITEGISKEELWLHVGLITGAYPLMQFLFAPSLGLLSDRIGRRPLILTGLAGYALATFLFSISGSIVFLYIFRLAAGLFSAAFLTASSAYIADNSTEEKRAAGMAAFVSVASLGAVAGPLIRTLFSKASITFGRLILDSFALPFTVSSLLVLAAFAFLVFMLAEVKKVKQNRTGEKEKPAKESVLVFLKSISHSFVLLLLFSFISQFALAMFEGTIALHSQRLFAFGPRQMSIVFMVCGSLMGLLQWWPVAWLIKKWGEQKLLPYGLVILGIGMSLIMIPRELEFILFYVAVISVGMAILTPALASLVTKESRENFGISLGVFSSVNSLGQVIGVLIGSVLMIWFDHLPYYLISVLLFIAALFSIYGFRRNQ